MKLNWYLFGAATGILSSQMMFAAAGGQNFDVVVYGATAGGVVASVAAARQGLHVALVEPGRHVGGMVSSGLDTTDRGNVDSIGGLPHEFFTRVGHHYAERVEYDFEPHVAEQVFNDMLREAHVAIFFGDRLRETGGVTKAGPHISSITMENGAVFSAKEFIDCTYEGDLMVAAGVSNTYGREPAAQYGESLGGVVPTQRTDHQWVVKVSPYRADGSLDPLVSSQPKGAIGSGDKKSPAYTYRLCVTDDKEDQAPWPKPEGYDPKRYDLYGRYLNIRVNAKDVPRLKVNDPKWGLFMAILLRNAKYDLNSMGALSTDYIGADWDYPTANYKQREVIAQEHYKYEAGLLYFLAHDPSVPKYLQDGFNQFGLCKDEFTDTNNWPRQLYVREVRRMLGEYVLTQHDIQDTMTKPDSIGLASYEIDSHGIQRVITPDGGIENEGDIYTAVKPYEIPYRSIVPKHAEATNLLVPVAMSASHVGYSSIRQEPDYMILGQAAGTAATIAAKKKVDVQDVPVDELQERLTEAKVILHWTVPSK